MILRLRVEIKAKDTVTEVQDRTFVIWLGNLCGLSTTCWSSLVMRVVYNKGISATSGRSCNLILRHSWWR